MQKCIISHHISDNRERRYYILILDDGIKEIKTMLKNKQGTNYI